MQKRVLELFSKYKNIIIFMLVFGFMANILVITNEIVGGDSIVFSEYYISSSWDISLGRWALGFFSRLRYGLSSSVVSTILSLIFVSFSTILIIDLFDQYNLNYKKGPILNEDGYSMQIITISN